jgi:Tol biopolymer transport system component
VGWEAIMRTIRLALLAAALAVLGSALVLTQSGQDLFQQALVKEQADGDLRAAIAIYQRIVRDFTADRMLTAKALVQIGRCYDRLGQAETSEARKAYERVVREFGDQKDVAAEARARLAALANPPGAPSGTTLAVRRVWYGPEVDQEGGVSRDGRYLSFVDWSTGDLAVRDLATGENRRLTKNGPQPFREYADFATFSPDGRQVAYGWCCNSDGNYELRSIGIDGSGQRTVHRSQEFWYFLPLEWSRDGRTILSIVSQKSGNSLALVSASDGAVRVLKPTERSQAQGASLSPDGRWLAYGMPGGEDPGQYDIRILATDGSSDAPLVEHPSRDILPVWTPDGQQILFVSDRGGTLGLWIVPVAQGRAQGEPRLVKPDVGRIRPLGFSDAGVFHYGLLAGTGDVYEMAIDPASGKLASRPSVAFKHYVGFNGTPDYSPDARFLACLSLRGSTMALVPHSRSLVIRTLKTGAERELPLTFAPGWEVRWSPDSRFVMLPGRDSQGAIRTFRIDATTGEQTPVSDIGGMTNQYGSQRGWFPDQKAIFIVSRAPRDEQGKRAPLLIRQDLETRKVEYVRLSGLDNRILLSVTLSPDGQQFAGWSGHTERPSIALVTFPVAGGEPRELFSVDNANVNELAAPLRGLAWTPDSRHLVFARRSETKRDMMDLWRIAAGGGAPENLGPLLEKVFDIVVHPAGDRIAFSTRDLKQEVWVLENFLPSGRSAR